MIFARAGLVVAAALLSFPRELLAQNAGTARLTNLSVRANSGSGSNVLIAGFVIAGGSKNVLVRGDGPTLASYGVAGALNSVNLGLFDSSSTQVGANIGWSSGSASQTAGLTSAFSQVGAFPLPVGSLDSALFKTLVAGAYSAQVAGVSGATGVGLAEIYDADGGNSNSRITNISARAQVGASANVLIAGFTVGGTGTEQLLVRGIGPALASYGVAGVLAAPQLTIYNASGVAVASNSGWDGSPEMQTIFASVGAFSLSTNSLDSALVVTLPPGNYTAVVSGLNGSSGVALVEVYELPAAGLTPGIGATVPWARYEGENGILGGNAVVLGPNRSRGDPAGEASGRKCVRLVGTGDYVQWLVTAHSSALVARISTPDAPTGGGIDSTLGVYRNGVRVQSLAVTSRYSWVYGDSADVTGIWSKDPSMGSPRRIYDETQLLLTTPLESGDLVRLQKDAGDIAGHYDIDFIELEDPVELPQPSNSISIASQGAVADGVTDCASAIEATIAAAKAQGKAVWIPRGQFRQSRRIVAGGVTIQGAGMWFSELWSYNSGVDIHNGGGFEIDQDNSVFQDFRVRGEVQVRDPNSSDAPFLGQYGNGSVLKNLWIEHFNVGIWSGNPGAQTVYPSNLTVSGCRIRDNFADGINLSFGTQNSTVTNCTVRNAGDDSFAIWSSTLAVRPSNGNTVRNCTAECNFKAAAFAVYGGGNNLFDSNLGVDTLVYPGIDIQAGFSSYPFQGTTTLNNNVLIRCGGEAYSPIQEFGAIWVFAGDLSIPGTITLTGNTILDATYSAVLLQANTGFSISGPVVFNNLTVNGAAQYIIVRSGSVGSVTFNGSKVTNIANQPLIQNNSSTTFSVITTP
jgi:hypothetical protein